MQLTEFEIISLIKKTEGEKIDSWKCEYFEKIARQLQVHTKGHLFKKIDTLFPNENPDSKRHCIDTYEPITKGSIWKGINNIHRIFSNSSFSINVGDELKNWIADYSYAGNNIINFFLDLWITKSVSEDPNGLFVIYPLELALENDMCPVQFVQSELIKHVCESMVCYISEKRSKVEYSLEDYVTKRQIYFDESISSLNSISCAEITYNRRLRIKVIKPVVHVITTDFLLEYKSEDGKKFEYNIFYFKNKLSQIPSFTGGGIEIDRADIPIYDSFVSPFIPFGNLSLLQHRNHRAVDLMFSYPRMSELQTLCEHCIGGKVKVKRSDQQPDGISDCSHCKGSGFITVQSPYKVYTRKYDPNDAGRNEHLKINPVEFHSPDVSIINYSKESWKEYLTMAEDSIYINQKIYTGQVQSAESKGLDNEEFYAWLGKIGKTFYKNLCFILQSLEEYVSASPIKCTVEKPHSYAIITEGEAFQALNNILMSDAPVFIKAFEIDSFTNKFLTDSSPVVKSISFLKKYDPILFYKLVDVQNFKSNNIIDNTTYTKHILSYPILMSLYDEDNSLFTKSYDQIKALVDAGVEKLMVPEVKTNFIDQLDGKIV